MVKAFGTLIFRGVVGIVSIATTALITVLVQRYLYEKTGTPALLFAPPPSSEVEQPIIQPPAAANSPEAVDPAPVNSEMGVSPEPEFDQSEPDQSEFAQPEFDQSQFNPSDQFAIPETVPESADRQTQIMEQFWDKLNR